MSGSTGLANARLETKLNLKKNRVALLCWLTLILLLGSFATSIAIHNVASNSLRKSIVERELPITSDSLYSEIQHDLVLPVFICGQMASNTLLHLSLIHIPSPRDKRQSRMPSSA